MRLFVAVWPPDDIVEPLRRLPRPAIDGMRWTTEDQWHVTLRFLGDVDDVGSVVDSLASVHYPPAEVRIGPTSTRLGAGILMLPITGLDDLAAAIPLPLDRPFTGHLTLARARNRRSIPASLEGTPFDASWTARSFALVQSQTRPTGAVYTDVATFSLGASPATRS